MREADSCEYEKFPFKSALFLFKLHRFHWPVSLQLAFRFEMDGLTAKALPAIPRKQPCQDSDNTYFLRNRRLSEFETIL